jgi:hypothetical protein
MKYTNLTPHTINVFRAVVGGEGGTTGEHVQVQAIAPSGQVARVAQSNTYCWTDTTTGIDMYRAEYGAVTGLPEHEEGVMLIVSGMVREAASDRSDVCSPGDLLRDDAGKPIGCIGLFINKQR